MMPKTKTQSPSVGTARLVIVDPRLDDYRCLADPAAKNQLRLTLTTTGTAALRLLPSFGDAVWLISPQLPDMNGLELLEMLHSLQSQLRAVVIDKEYDQERELQAIRQQAIQYVCKPMHAAWLASWNEPNQSVPSSVASNVSTAWPHPV